MSKLSLTKRLKMAGNLIWGSPWDGANLSPNRARVNSGYPQDFKYELNHYTREELVRNMRHLTKNSGFIREYRNTLALYSAPVTPQAQTESHAWNTEAEELYKDRRRYADVTGRFNGEEIQTLISKAIDTDGEIFIIKVIDRISQLPKLQILECHRVGDFGKGDTLDGFKVNAQGRPVAIKVKLDNGNTRFIPMKHVLHIYDPDSASALRHAPTLAHSIPHVLDAEELISIEKKGVKDINDKTFIWKTHAGSMDDDELEDMISGSQGTEAERTDPMAAAKIIGGKNIIAQVGEDVETIQSNRPSATFTGFMDHLYRDSAMGGLPYEFFVNASGLNAGAIRLVTARVQRVAQRRSNIILERFLRPDWFFTIGNAIDNGELEPIKGWNKIKGGFPKQVTVDAGRNEESLRRSIDMGLVSPSEAFAEKGDGFAEAMERKAADLETLNEIAERHGLKPEQLFQFTSNAGKSASGTPPSAKAPKAK